MKTIFKYKLASLTVANELMMPEGAQILTVQMQGHMPCVWALVDKNAALKPASLVVYGTGHTLPDNPGKYIGTYQAGAYVWHLFQEGA